MMNITLLKTYREKETLKVVDLEQVVDMIRTAAYRKEIYELQNLYPIVGRESLEDGSTWNYAYVTQEVPRLCFAAAWVNRNRQRVNLGYSGLVLLEVNNLTSYEEAAAIRNGADAPDADSLRRSHRAQREDSVSRRTVQRPP